MITHIIWDYNGTVLNDVDISVAAVNKMLKRRGLPLTNIDDYKKTLSIPILDYYKGIGITGQSIEQLSSEFYAACTEFSDIGGIFDEFYEVIDFTKRYNITNILMSSLYHEHLLKEVKKHGILDCFNEVIGMQNSKLGSKLANAEKYIETTGLDPKNVLFIGDLTSDAQMAKAIGARCILIPNGHNSKERCQKEGVTVLENLTLVKEYISAD